MVRYFAIPLALAMSLTGPTTVLAQSAAPAASAQPMAPAPKPKPKPKPKKDLAPKPPVSDACPMTYSVIGYFRDGKTINNVCGNGDNLCLMEATGDLITCEGFTLYPGKSAF